MKPIIFDLDDTLYPEITYVYSGFEKVSSYLHSKYGFSRIDVFNEMKLQLKHHGRNKIFDQVLQNHDIYSKENVRKCVSIYRSHTPIIQLFPEADQLLSSLDKNALFLVTDGNKIVQRKKIEALGLKKRFNRVFVTHQYGLKHSKPSTYCFKLIRNLCNCSWEHMTYIGDNPKKDFVNLKPLGVRTIRVRTGYFQDFETEERFEAALNICDLNSLFGKLSAN